MDRKDLIVDMRMKIGDWERVIKLAEKYLKQHKNVSRLSQG